MLAPAKTSVADLDRDTLEKISESRYDFFVEKHEGPLAWRWLIEERAVEFVSIRGMDVLLPVEKEHHGNMEVLRLIISEDRSSLTVFFTDATYDKGRSAGRVAVCDRAPGREWYVAVLYHEWLMVYQEETLTGVES